MKKLLMACLVACTAFGTSAQIIRSTTSEQTLVTKQTVPTEKSWNHSGLFINTGVGVLTGDADTDFAWELGWGYRWHVASGISWEVFRLGFNAGVSDFKETLNLRITTGLRYDTPRFDFLGNRSLFANFCLGYGGRPAAEYTGSGGFAWELGVGFKFNRKCSVSLIYQANSDNDIDIDDYYGYEYDLSWGMVGFKFEYQFR